MFLIGCWENGGLSEGMMREIGIVCGLGTDWMSKVWVFGFVRN